MNESERSWKTAGVVYRDLSLVIRPLRRVVAGEEGYLTELYEGMPGETARLLARGQLPPLDYERGRKLPPLHLHRPCLEAIIQRGAYIWEQFIGEEIGQCLRARIAEVAGTDGTKLRLRLCWDTDLFTELEYRFDLEGLLIKEWEKDKEVLDYSLLALHPAVAVVRHTLGTAAEFVPEFGPLKVLIIYANPGLGFSCPPIPDLRRQLEEVERCLGQLQKDGWIQEVRKIENPTPGQVVEVLRSYAPQVLIFLGHGYGGAGGGLVLAPGADGNPYLVGPVLASAVQGRGLKLVVLLNCQSALAAPHLLLAGVPAVVAMRYEIPQSHIVPMTWAFFEHLARRAPLEECVQALRTSLRQNPGIEHPLWLAPTLYFSAPDGQLFGSQEDLLKGSYLEKLKAICNHFPTEVFNPDRKDWTVSEKYVQTVVREEVKNDADSVKAEPAERTVPKIIEREVDKALQEHKQVTVVADAGTGKTSLLHDQVRKVISAHRTASDLIPILIHLKDWGGKGSLKDFLRVQHPSLPMWGENLLGEKIGEWLSQQYEQGKCLLFFDALDEVEQSCRQDVVEALNGLRSPFILTTRPAGYDGRLRAKKVELLVFTEEQIQGYATAYLGIEEAWERFSAALGGHAGTRALAENPLLLSLLCYLFAQGRLKLPASRAELFEEAVEERLTARSARTEKDDRRRLLEEGGFHSFFCGGRKAEISERMLLSLARKVAGKQEGSLLKDEVLQSGLLTKNGSNSYSFLHPRFQEYFAAAALKRLAKEPKGRCWLFEGETYSCEICHTALAPFSHYFWHPDWQDSITLLAGLLDDATPLLTYIQAEPDDVFHQMLTLAACCLGSARKAEQKVAREIVEAVCQEWKKAVKESRSFDTVVFEALSKGRQEKWAEQVCTFLCGRLKDEEGDVCEAAAEALGELKDSRAVPALLEALKDEDEEGYVRRVAARALGKIKDPRAVPALLVALKDENWGVREAAAEALEAIKDPRAVPALLEALKDKEGVVRRAVAWVLGAIKDPRVVPELLMALKDENWLVRRAVARALKAIKDPRTVPELLVALKDEGGDVRRAVARALEAIKDPRAVPELLVALKDEGGDVRRAAAWVLEAIKDPRAVPELLEALKDENWDVREAAAEALEVIKDPRAVPELLEALKDEEGFVRRAAAWALGEIGAPDAGQPLLSAARRWKDESLWKALQTLTQRAKIRIYEDGKWEPLPPVEPSSVQVITHAARGRR